MAIEATQPSRSKATPKEMPMPAQTKVRTRSVSNRASGVLEINKPLAQRATEEKHQDWYQGFWKSDALPISFIVLMLLAIFIIALVSR
jgi:hypothetical protein